jgi:L-serine dehydratase
MVAVLDFRDEVAALPLDTLSMARTIRARLFGSLSATGFGHGTHNAVVTGFLGHKPADCPASLPTGVFDLPEEGRIFTAGPFSCVLGREAVKNDAIEHLYPYSNTMVCELLGDDGTVLHAKTYYSVGAAGSCNGKAGACPNAARCRIRIPHSSVADLQRIVNENGLSIPQIILLNKMALTGARAPEVFKRLDGIIEIMRRSVARGVSTGDSMLPGSLRVYRKAAYLAGKADSRDDPLNRFLGLLNAYVFAVSEENAAGGIIVTAPTCGAAGVMPAVLTMIEGYLGVRPGSPA